MPPSSDTGDQTEIDALRIHDLGVQYNAEAAALKSISFTSDAPEVIALIGPSGAGKSTLLKAIAGLTPLASGEIHLGAQCVSKLTGAAVRHYQRRVGIIWQENYLPDRLSALQATLTGQLTVENSGRALLGAFSRERRERAFERLRDMGVARYAHQRIDRLSGGEKQRVGIARAFFAEPELLLADEPVASLDPALAERILEQLVDNARRDRKRALITLHQVDLAKRFADRIIALRDGRIVFDGAPSQLDEPTVAAIYGTTTAHTATEDPTPRSEKPSAPTTAPVTSQIPPAPGPSWATLSTLLGLIIFCGLAMQATGIEAGKLAEGWPHLLDFLQRLLPPKWEWAQGMIGIPPDTRVFGLPIPSFTLLGSFQYPELLVTMFETVQMAFLGTLFGAFAAIPMALLAARNLAPNALVYNSARFVLNANRAVPDLVFALIVVAAYGLGPFSGVMALSVASIGSLGKVFAEIIESVNPKPLLAMRATGAGPLLAFRFGIFPQAMPMMASYALLYFEHNMRTATILGLVGAGGIGYELNKYMSTLQYPYLFGAILIIVLCVTVLDQWSDCLRRRLL